MSWIVIFTVSDCQTGSNLPAVVSDNNVSAADANGQFRLIADDDALFYNVLVQGIGISHLSKVVTFTPQQAGTVQRVCLDQAPPPDPQAVAPPYGLKLASYENQQATFEWSNGSQYTKILFSWKFKGPGNGPQTTLDGHPTSHTLGPIYPEQDYVITLEGGQGNDVFGWRYSHPGTVLEWHSPPGPWPVPNPGAFVPGERISAVARRADHLDLFGAGGDGAVRTTAWQEGTGWFSYKTGMASLGGAGFAGGVGVSSIARTPDHLDLFLTGKDGVVYTSYWQTGKPWTPWRGIGGFFPANAAVTPKSRVPNQIDLFVTGNNGVVYTQWGAEGAEWSGVNNNWRPIGGIFPPGAPIAATTRNPNQFDLFIVGNNGQVYTSWWYLGSDWSGIGNKWTSLGGSFAPGAPISAVTRTPDHIDLFLTGKDGVVYTSYWQTGKPWTPWRGIGGFFPANAPVTPISRVPNQIDLFVTGNNGVVYTQWGAEGAEWSGVNNNWRPIGGFFPPGAPIAATTRNPNQFDLFIVGNNRIINSSWWYLGSDWSGINNNWAPIGG